ncbi:hypothetical protein GCM10027062_27900 [Nocardioides hungaricus]
MTASRMVTAAEIEEWGDITADQARSYTLEPSGTQADIPAGALSVRRLVEMLSPELDGLSVENVTYVSVPRPRRDDEATLDQESDNNLGRAGENGFADGLMPAVYVVGRSTSVGYIRPLRGSADENILDYFQSESSPPSPLYLTLHTSGSILRPEITASSLRVEVGEPVTFTADVSADTPLSYDWSIQGAPASSEEQPVVTWETGSQAGYLVSLTVTGADSSAGQSNSLRVIVDDPESEEPEPTEDPEPTDAPGGGGPTDHPTAGPDRGDGGNAGGVAEPSTAPAPGGARGTTEAPSQRGATPPAVTGGETITGILLTGAITEAEAGEPVTAPSARATTSNRPLRLPGWLLLGVAVQAILGLGVLSEARTVRGRVRS